MNLEEKIEYLNQPCVGINLNPGLIKRASELDFKEEMVNFLFEKPQNEYKSIFWEMLRQTDDKKTVLKMIDVLSRANKKELNNLHAYLGGWTYHDYEVLTDMLLRYLGRIDKVIPAVNKVQVKTSCREIRNMYLEFLRHFADTPGIEQVMYRLKNIKKMNYKKSCELVKEKLHVYGNNMDLFALYDNRIDLADALFRCDRRDKTEILRDEQVIEFANECMDYNVIGDVLYIFQYKGGETLDVVEIGKKFDPENAKKVTETLAAFAKRKKYDQSLRLIEQYHDNNFSALYVMLKAEVNLDALETDQAYEAVKKSKNPLATMKRIVSDEYDEVRMFNENLRYKDMDLIIETLDFVDKIHRERGSHDLAIIHMSFYGELERAMQQVDDYDKQCKNLRQFCYEVKRKIRANAAELMVVNNV